MDSAAWWAALHRSQTVRHAERLTHTHITNTALWINYLPIKNKFKREFPFTTVVFTCPLVTLNSR